MTVPMTSAGSKSGVNWMRANLALMAWQSVRTVSVFARPGTPSRSTWPPVSKPMSTRSSMWVWPTTTLPTSFMIFSTNALSLATSSFNARTSYMAGELARTNQDVHATNDLERAHRDHAVHDDAMGKHGDRDAHTEETNTNQKVTHSGTHQPSLPQAKTSARRVAAPGWGETACDKLRISTRT